MSYPQSPIKSPIKDLKQVVPIPLDEIELRAVSSHEFHSETKSTRNILSVLGSIQKYSAYGFSTFLGIHISSVVIVPIIPYVPYGIKQEVFEMARAVYHSIPFFESAMILGSVGLHIVSGLGIRYFRNVLQKQKSVRKISHTPTQSITLDEALIKDETRSDIGLGGITGLIGLGYKKAIISRLFPSLSPLSFSGFILLPLLTVHFAKFRYFPTLIDGDSSLINLDYITYVLNFSPVPFGKALNFGFLGLLLWVMMYHSVSGMLRFQRKFSRAWKTFGYTVINGVSILGFAAIVGYKNNLAVIDAAGYFGKSFLKYINASWF